VQNLIGSLGEEEEYDDSDGDGTGLESDDQSKDCSDRQPPHPNHALLHPDNNDEEDEEEDDLIIDG